MYSQNDEEAFILQHFGSSTCEFLDIGAFDGKTFSNTYALVERGWGGVCVEASPITFTRLLALHKDNPKVKNILAAVSPKEAAVIPWWDSMGDGVSTTSPEHADRWEKGSNVRYTRFYTHTLPVQALFDAFGYDFSFINIDVESTNLAIFEAMPWEKLTKTELVCVEHDRNIERMTDLAKTHGFRPITVNPENLILAR